MHNCDNIVGVYDVEVVVIMIVRCSKQAKAETNGDEMANIH